MVSPPFEPLALQGSLLDRARLALSLARCGSILLPPDSYRKQASLAEFILPGLRPDTSEYGPQMKNKPIAIIYLGGLVGGKPSMLRTGCVCKDLWNEWGQAGIKLGALAR